MSIVAMAWVAEAATPRQTKPSSLEGYHPFYVAGILKYSTWVNQSKGHAIRLVYVGDDREQIQAFREGLSGRVTRDRAIELVVVEELDEALLEKQIHVIYFAPNRSDTLSDSMKAVKGKAILSICNARVDQWLSAGAMVNLVESRGELKIDLNVGIAEEVGVRFEARFLRLVREIWPKEKRRRRK